MDGNMSCEGFRFVFDDNDNSNSNNSVLPALSTSSCTPAERHTTPLVSLSQFPVYALTRTLLKEWADCYPKDPRYVMELNSDYADDGTSTFPTLLYQRAPHVRELTTEGEGINNNNNNKVERRDIIPGKYYGGLKVWSCAPYLVDYMYANRDVFSSLFKTPLKTVGSNSSKEVIVAEVGCGQALPGIAALLLGADRVIFQDYNEEVLELCVKPNIAVNWLRSHAKKEEEESDVYEQTDSVSPPTVQMVSGDWMSLNWGSEENKEKDANKQNVRCKVVLGSDVTFDEEACEKLADMLGRCLAPAATAGRGGGGGGVAYIATKQYYFGTNGGALEFRKRAENHGLRVSEVHRMDEAGGMQRVIMRVTHQC